jgi:hypothetical protein
MRTVAVTILVASALMATSGLAGATGTKATPKACVKHPHRVRCANTGGGAATGGATAGTSPQITLQVDPEPVIETSSSAIAAVIQVEASPSLAGDIVNVDSAQLEQACAAGTLGYIRPHSDTSPQATLTLDNDGNASTAFYGQDCAPGSDIIEADLTVAPFVTAVATLVVHPPAVTTPGLTGYPTTSGVVTTGEVETGDTAASGDSDVEAVFEVEADPVYAEQPVEFDLAQLESRCLASEGWAYFPFGGVDTTEIDPGGTIDPPVRTTLDDDGNAVLIFIGSSCAAGPSDVIADVLAGTNPTYTTTFTIDAPQPTI